MSRMISLLFFLLSAEFVFGENPSESSTSSSPDRMNIVLIVVDDLGWSDLGCQGSRYYKTPNIDSLANHGLRFTDAYAACAVCSPTRAAIMTGKYPARLLLTDWLPAGRWDPKSKLKEGRFVRGLPPEEQTLAETLRDAGYKTACIGKWHLGSEPFSLPEHHGFDINIGGNAHGAPGQYFFPYQGNWLIPSTQLRATWNVLADGKQGEYLTDRLTDEAIAFVRQAKEQPFFLYLPHYGVHTPLQAKPEKIAAYEQVPEAERPGKPVYAAMIESIDESVGRIMNTLKELNLDRRTLVIFTSDNGGFYGATSNAPLRANKGAYYEGGIRVPLIVHAPTWIPKAGVCQLPVTSTDLYPTCLQAAGLPLQPNQHCDGVSLMGLIQGTSTLERRSLFWHYPHYNEHPSSVPCSAIRRENWKLIESFDPEQVELFDLEKDIGETQNLADTHQELVASMLDELEQWRLGVGAERMKPNPDHDPSAAPKKKKKANRADH
ncbi:MAG: sulfatase [Pirellula sp.]